MEEQEEENKNYAKNMEEKLNPRKIVNRKHKG